MAQTVPFAKGATMTSDDPLRDDEMETARDQEPADPDQATAAPAGAVDTGVMMDAADSGNLDQSDVPAPSGASDTGAMMDARDTGTVDQSDVPAPSGASDTGVMMDAADTGTVDRTDVGEPGDADAGEPDR
jgi:hypothetical protein